MKDNLRERLTQLQDEAKNLALELNEVAGEDLYNKHDLLRSTAAYMVERAYKSKEEKELLAKINKMSEDAYFNYVKETLLRDFKFGWMKLINSTTAIIEDRYPGGMGTAYVDTIFKGPIDEAIKEYLKNRKDRRIY